MLPGQENATKALGGRGFVPDSTGGIYRASSDTLACEAPQTPSHNQPSRPQVLSRRVEMNRTHCFFDKWNTDVMISVWFLALLVTPWCRGACVEWIDRNTLAYCASYLDNLLQPVHIPSSAVYTGSNACPFVVDQFLSRISTMPDLPNHRRQAGQTRIWISNPPNARSRWKPA